MLNKSANGPVKILSDLVGEPMPLERLSNGSLLRRAKKHKIKVHPSFMYHPERMTEKHVEFLLRSIKRIEEGGENIEEGNEWGEGCQT